ncbi:peptide methionine sulfoxide reductase-like [Saccoglossus kowalevskii]|uniref:peptide-methionine (S)-S-oxide reductase n=1 Tax=Saccoglossus kowalevskii TaxID=10224 RepID=A0ABM0MY24_SACKO|nr:PREDICTED: peptide methionine sulfoxide reductase-like [Saccoglossus kowalevskii]
MKYSEVAVFALLLMVTMTTVAIDDEEGCDESESLLLKYTFEPSGLKYTEPDVKTKKATFAMGCFWGVESTFGAAPGVVRVKCGYTGGSKLKPTYTNLGDHTESVEIEYDPTKTTYRQLLDIFWKTHDPTEWNKSQYKSAVYAHDEEQEIWAQETLLEEQKNYGSKVVTDVLPAGTFYDAENYHQKYFLRFHDNLLQSLGMGDGELLTSYRASRLLGYITGNGSVEEFNKEVKNLALSNEQANYIRKIIRNKNSGSCAKKSP